jgi:hypothetical protein
MQLAGIPDYFRKLWPICNGIKVRYRASMTRIGHSFPMG